MPALANTSKTVLVTGASGYIATWIVGDLLQKGYTVRAAVRTEVKGKHLLKLYKDYGDKLSIVAVGDIVNQTAFDEAVRDVHGIIHTASPLHLSAVEPSEIIEPAVGGILGIMKSALKNGNALERLVYTSSCAAIRHFSLTPVTISEENWNEGPVKQCEEKGKDADNLDKYIASKYFAEKAAWAFYEEHKSEIKWDLSVINPPWVFGPSKHDIKSVSDLPEAAQFLYGALVKEDFGGYPPLYTPGSGYVDVRDVSLAHLKALETPEAGGERIIICAGPWVWQDALDAANSLSPSPYSKPISKGTPGDAVRNISWNTSKEQKLFGIKFRGLKEIVKDVLEEYESRGF